MTDHGFPGLSIKMSVSILQILIKWLQSLLVKTLQTLRRYSQPYHHPVNHKKVRIALLTVNCMSSEQEQAPEGLQFNHLQVHAIAHYHLIAG